MALNILLPNSYEKAATEDVTLAELSRGLVVTFYSKINAETFAHRTCS